jgi:hypothetical protein
VKSLCTDPYIDGYTPRACGRCPSCLRSRSWDWTSRNVLEWMSHDDASFVTLTYSDDNLPLAQSHDGLVFPSLNFDHLRDFNKRFRDALPYPIRFYAIGEYSPVGRPHFHIAYYGLPTCAFGQTRGHKHAKGQSCCDICDLVFDKWGHGKIEVAELVFERIAYIAGYLTDKLMYTATLDPCQTIPAQRMSNRPGLGCNFTPKLMKVLKHYECWDENGDVPHFLNMGGKKLHLDRYMRKKLREQSGFEEIYDEETGEIKTLQEFITKSTYEQEMLAVYKDYLASEEAEKGLSYKAYLLKLRRQGALNIEAKQKLHQQRRQAHAW